jgi:hypothetical protein
MKGVAVEGNGGHGVYALDNDAVARLKGNAPGDYHENGGRIER